MDGSVTADDGCRLWTHSSGAGSGIVLCHGGPGYWDTLAPIGDLLVDRAQVVRWDQRGGGRSEHRGPYTVARMIADLDAVRAHHGFETVTLVGHSWGATLALQYALALPERVDQLVYVAGVGLSWDWREEHVARHRAKVAALPRAVSARIGELQGRPERSPAQERELDMLTLSIEFADPAAGLVHALEQVTPHFVRDPLINPALNAEARTWAEADLVRRCQALEVPTLIVDGGLDLRPRWSVDSLAAALPNARRVVFEAAGHFPWVDEPGGFALALRGFVTGSPARG